MTWRPLFIVGVGRSGTSLLQSALAAHPSIESIPETSFLREYVLSGRLDRAFKEGGPTALTRLLEGCTRLVRTGVTPEYLVRAANDNASRFSAKHLYESLLETRDDTGNANWVLDKDPRLIESLPAIASLWPNSAVIHIIRDPRDVLASKKAAAWAKEHGPLRHIAVGAAQLAVGRTQGPRTLKHRYLEVLYESLLESPEATLTTACDFLNVTYTPTMLDFTEQSRQLVADDELAWKRETMGPIVPDNAGKWRTSLSPWEVNLVDCTSVPLLSDLGYAASTATIRTLTPVLSRALRGAARLAAPIVKEVGS